MGGKAIAVMAGLILCYALLARRLTLANVTAPMLSVLAGMFVFPAATSISTRALSMPWRRSRWCSSCSTMRPQCGWSAQARPGIALRLLAIGFPLALLASFLVSYWMLPALGLAGAWLLAAAITPPTPDWAHRRCSIPSSHCGLDVA